MTNATLLQYASSEAHAKPILHEMDSFLRHLGYNAPTGLGKTNIHAIFFTLVVVFLGVLLYDWIAYHYALNHGNISSYSSYGRKLLSSAADIWDKRNIIGLDPYMRESRSMDDLEPMVDILNTLSKAIHKWEDNGTSHKQEKKRKRPVVVE